MQNNGESQDPAARRKKVGTGLALGIVFGVAVGAAMGKIGLGLALGIVIGAVYDAAASRKS